MNADYSCYDCKQAIEKGRSFWLKSDIWDSIAKFDEVLCVACAEKRLGRKLAEADFSTQHLSNFLFGFLPSCDQCHAQPKAKHVNDLEMFLCWDCFDAWRKDYFGANYIYCIPIEKLIEIRAQVEAIS